VGGQPPAPAAQQPYSPYSPQAAQQPPPQAAQPQSPYAPPAQAQQPQQSYSPPQPSYAQQNQPQQPAYGQQQGQPQSAGGYNPPPPPGAAYDYDPYAVREEEPRSMTRWIVFGCLGVSALCCCGTIAGLFLVDALCLWNRVPLLGDLVKAVGYNIVCK
ncbi:MAG: hypothetical protein H0X30_29390, partial [Anaerolineae bacterium]|nr:hypothetical protein [Anaerolineae bacterium]